MLQAPSVCKQKKLMHDVSACNPNMGRTVVRCCHVCPPPPPSSFHYHIAFFCPAVPQRPKSWPPSVLCVQDFIVIERETKVLACALLLHLGKDQEGVEVAEVRGWANLVGLFLCLCLGIILRTATCQPPTGTCNCLPSTHMVLLPLTARSTSSSTSL